jgi:ribosomal protein S18 acetylase RimI-like enzyme
MKRAPRTVIRPARPSDLPALGRMGAALARLHHEWDPRRFFLQEPMEKGYAWWLGKELKNEKAVVLVAARGRRVLGYAYGTLEPRDWNALRDVCGVLVDLMLTPEERGSGTGRLLAEAAIDALVARGAPRVVLQSAARNRAAQRFFKSLGFRPTMVELTREA